MVIKSWKEIINHTFKEDRLVLLTFSNPKKESSRSISIRPVRIKEENFYQVSKYYQTKSVAENLSFLQISDLLLNESGRQFRQAFIRTNEEELQFLSNRHGEWTLRKRIPKVSVASKEHNREKKYLIPEGTPIAFMIALGIMNEKGLVFPKKRAKFIQVNQFLEQLALLIKECSFKRTIHIIDLGCGKAYLTFAAYYYLKECLNLDVNIKGVDLKQEVVEFCSRLKEQLGYEHLSFVADNIYQLKQSHPVDIVIALHACDVATDYAIDKAIAWNAQALFIAPCCQQELLQMMHPADLTILLKHGIFKERFAALLTDALRAELLECCGYKTKIIEFVDIEHSPKNTALLAVRKRPIQWKLSSEYLRIASMFQVKPTLERLLADRYNHLQADA